MSKGVKCIKCDNVFNMDETFIGTILCEDCDPFMNGKCFCGYTSSAVKEVVEAAREVAEKGWWDGERLITDRINRLQKALESLDKKELV